MNGRHLLWLRTASIIVGHLFLLVACTNAAPESASVTVINTPPASATPSVTPTWTAVPTATHTPTPTPTATPSPTPTATAVPLNVTDQLRSLQIADPLPQANAACGLVDLFDFPIDPPDAANVSRGGADFGIFRDRFDKFHAGEDWGGPSNRPNLGTPVYSIGHGLVTYAQPLGWGRDKGVIIIQHTFADGRQVFSFYGHLDPDSVVAAPGACIRRGELVGRIGQPRGFPHLHFEVRTQAPYQTLTGYWPEDPTTQGWLWPSQQIWAARVGAIPGVAWVRPFVNRGTQPIGLLDETSYLFLEGNELLRLNMNDGRATPIDFGLERIDAALHQPDSQLLVLADRSSDTLFAYGWPNLIQQWQTDLQLASAPALLPLPGGGVLALTRSSMTALSADGTSLWTESLEGPLLDWLLTDNELYLTTDGHNGRLWRVQPEQAAAIAAVSGKLEIHDGGLWLYHPEGLYHIDLSSAPRSNFIYSLPPGNLNRGDLLALPDGTLLLAHADAADRRLLQFDRNGRLIWERSLAPHLSGAFELHLVNDQPYLAASTLGGSSGQLALYALDQEQARLTLLFAGGSRTPVINDMWITAVADNQLFVNVGGGPLALFDPSTKIR